MIKIGDKIPNAILKTLTNQGLADVNLAERLQGKKVVLFGIPGAFTGTCTNLHVPSFVEFAEQIKSKGVDEIICVAVNDPFVMKALEETTKAKGKVTLLSDWDAAFSKAMGLTMDASIFALGIRSVRYTAIIEDSILKHIEIENDASACGITKADSLLKYL